MDGCTSLGTREPLLVAFFKKCVCELFFTYTGFARRNPKDSVFGENCETRASRMEVVESKGGRPRLLDLLCTIYKTDDVQNLNLFSHSKMRGCDLARTETRTLPCYFEGSAARFQAAIEKGARIRLTVEQIVEGALHRFIPRANRAMDAAQGVNPEMYDMENVIINSIMIDSPSNTLPVGVGINTNGIPKAFEKIRDKQAEDLRADLGLKPTEEGKAVKHIIAHIPARSNDSKRIPLLKPGTNSWHGEELSRTFGGLCEKHLWKGIHALSPAQCIELGFPPLPRDHEPSIAPAGHKQAYNSWVIVPVGHVLSFVANMPPSDIANYGYCVKQLILPSGEPLPFLIMDIWTLDRYSHDTVVNNIQALDHRNLADMDIEIFPISGESESWLSGCRPAEHYMSGVVSFKLLITYTVFPKGMHENPNVIPGLSDRFPRMSAVMRNHFDTTDGKNMPAIKGKEGDEEEDDADAVETAAEKKKGKLPGEASHVAGEVTQMDMDDDDDHHEAEAATNAMLAQKTPTGGGFTLSEPISY